MEERITEEELKKVQYLALIAQSRAHQFISLVPSQETANNSLLDYLKELAEKYHCDYKGIMISGAIIR